MVLQMGVSFFSFFAKLKASQIQGGHYAEHPIPCEDKSSVL